MFGNLGDYGTHITYHLHVDLNLEVPFKFSPINFINKIELGKAFQNLKGDIKLRDSNLRWLIIIYIYTTHQLTVFTQSSQQVTEPTQRSETFK